MKIRARLLIRADMERLLLSKSKLTDTDELDHEQVIGICPIVELLELCELIKKGKIRANMTSFREDMQVFQDSLVRRGKVIIVDLDRNRLIDTLFEWDDDHAVIGLWPPAANRQISPAHSIRRLLLRPSEQTWWDGDIYAESEDIYGSIEDL